jgi:hypothetical protein
MKKFRLTICVLALTLFFCASVYAQPLPGSYDSHNGDFNAGTWSETLISGAEGAAGNLIASGATEYLFEGAVLYSVTPLGFFSGVTPYYEYSTLYKGGRLTLSNNSSADWYNSEDMEDAYLINLGDTVVVTKKFVDEENNFTGEIEFELTVTNAEFNDFPGWTASVAANYAGTPDYFPPPPAGYASLSDFLSSALITIQGPPTLVNVPVDIKPGSCPNPVNVKSKGVLPVAILGTADFDVTLIDPVSISLNGIVAPLRWSLEDVGTPFLPLVGNDGAQACHERGPDGYMDLGLKFDTQEFVASLIESLGTVNDRDTISVQLTGTLKDGTQIQGEDVILILKPGKNK